MSDFSEGWATYGASGARIERALTKLGLAAYLSPDRGEGIAVFPNGDPRKLGPALSRELPEATVVAISTGDDVRFAIDAFRASKQVLRLRLAQRLDAPTLTELKALAELLPGHRTPEHHPSGATSRAVYTLLRTPMGFNSYDRLGRYIEDDFEGAYEGFVHLLPDGTRTVARGIELPTEDELRAILEADRAIAEGKRPNRPKPVKAERPPEIPVVPPVRTKPRRRADPGGVGFVDLSRCDSARAWLDARKQVSPALATPELIAELERTIGAGRFAEEGEKAIVVREAAAMLLGRIIEAQDLVELEARLPGLAEAAASPAERSAWELALKLAREA